ncbi:MAG: PilT/PilU family type 4a pilus ATPase [Lentisphaeria bacterium]|nr:PilT/PilU family type 4a pilus ATPase [Lentisphaeria bacterium]
MAVQLKTSCLHDLLKYAVDERASDLHIRENKNVQLRIDSNLVQLDYETDSTIFNQFCNDIVPAGKYEEFKAKGDLDFAWQEPDVGRFRVNLHLQRGDRGITMRWVKSKAPTVKEAGLPEVLKDIASNSNGIIFITGTTGSGKSTTMAAMLDFINTNFQKHIITIEDPIEYTFEDNKSFFEQREVGLDAETFESALVHALRQDPDIIVVGEMRNRVTFETALAAAETGHMVITTLHTKDAPQSINRILDMFTIEERDSIRKSLSDVVKAIICQRLAKKASGKGVVPITEIMTNVPIVKKLIFDGRIDKLQQAIEANEEAGMMTFNQCLLKHYNNGDISEEKALELSDNPQALKMNFKGIFLTDSGGIIQ